MSLEGGWSWSRCLGRWIWNNWIWWRLLHRQEQLGRRRKRQQTRSWPQFTNSSQIAVGRSWLHQNVSKPEQPMRYCYRCVIRSRVENVNVVLFVSSNPDSLLRASFSSRRRFNVHAPSNKLLHVHWIYICLLSFCSYLFLDRELVVFPWIWT